MAASPQLSENGLTEDGEQASVSMLTGKRGSLGDTSCGSCEDTTMDAVSCGSDTSDPVLPISKETKPLLQPSPDSGTFGSLKDTDDLSIAENLHQKQTRIIEINLNRDNDSESNVDNMEENYNQKLRNSQLDEELNTETISESAMTEFLPPNDFINGVTDRPQSLSLPVPVIDQQKKRRAGDDLHEIHTSTDSELSRSLPFGMIVQKGDMIEFVADNLIEKIKRSSSLSIADSGSLPTRASSIQSLGSISSTTSQSISRASFSGISHSPSSLLQQSPGDIPPIDPQVILDLESQARIVADQLDLMMGNLKTNLHKMSALTSGCVDAYKKSVDSTCDAVDGSIKAMYAMMAKCEELDGAMNPIYYLADQIREIKRLLDIFESKLVEKS